jgi:O-antigen/teichoic acid export membrane protein
MGGLRLRFSTAYAKTALLFGLKAHVGEAAQYCNYRVDLLFVNYFAGLQAAGYYAIAVRIAELLFQISSSMRLVLFTRVVHLTKAEMDRLPPFLIRNTLLITGIVATGLYVASPLAVRLLLPAYLPSIPLLYLLLPGVCLATVFQMVTGALNGRGKPALSMYLMVGGLALGLATYSLMIPRFGAEGAALASTTVYTVESLVAAVILSRLLSTPLHLLLVPQVHDLAGMWRAGWQMSGNVLRLRRLPGVR